MGKQTLLAFLLIIITSCGHTILNDISYPQDESFESEKIKWNPNRPLKWSDFKGKKRMTKTAAVAETAAEIITEDSYWEEGIPVFKVNCYFLKNISWTVTDDIGHLRHEQLHFDIHEIYTRKIRKAFDSLNQKEIVDYKIYEQVFQDYLNKCDSVNDLYDSQTYFNDEEQQVWNEKISKQLKELDSLRG